MNGDGNFSRKQRKNNKKFRSKEILLSLERETRILLRNKKDCMKILQGIKKLNTILIAKVFFPTYFVVYKVLGHVRKKSLISFN